MKISANEVMEGSREGAGGMHEGKLTFLIGEW